MRRARALNRKANRVNLLFANLFDRKPTIGAAMA
jgi:hypothetical protein